MLRVKQTLSQHPVVQMVCVEVTQPLIFQQVASLAQ